MFSGDRPTKITLLDSLNKHSIPPTTYIRIYWCTKKSSNRCFSMWISHRVTDDKYTGPDHCSHPGRRLHGISSNHLTPWKTPEFDSSGIKTKRKGFRDSLSLQSLWHTDLCLELIPKDQKKVVDFRYATSCDAVFGTRHRSFCFNNYNYIYILEILETLKATKKKRRGTFSFTSSATESLLAVYRVVTLDSVT